MRCERSMRMAEFATDRFAFGRNWQKFSRLIDERRVEAAVTGLTGLLQRTDLVDRTFLDIGCGSGLSSLAALRLGATVKAFDFDRDSVDATRTNLTRLAAGGRWSVGQGSALDADYMRSLGQFDVVYTWGVLHHTGDMWRGIDLATRAVATGGILALAIYNDQGGASRRWRAVKRAYIRAPSALRPIIVLAVGLFFEIRSALIRCVRLQNPLSTSDWWRPRGERGMSLWHDLVDWVGGYPFEVAKPEDVFNFVRDRGFTLAGLKTCAGAHACNEYLFVRTDTL